MLCSTFSCATTTLVFILFVSIYSYVKYLYSYWQRRRVPYLKPSFPFGNFGKNFMQKLSTCAQVDEIYRETTEPFIGVYSLFRPTLVIRDPELIRTVLIKDFKHFADRGVYSDEVNDPLSAHLFALEGERWRNVRAKLSPAFTSGKLKAIFSTLLECKNPLEKYLAGVADSNQSVEAREMMACFTTNVIASVAFGIDVDCFADPETPFRKYGRRAFEQNLKNAFRMVCTIVSPTLMKWSRMHFLDREVEDFIYDMVKQTLELREKKNIVRKDLFQLLVQLRNTGAVQLDDEWQTTTASNKTLTIDEIAAQAFVFFAAGFETTSSTISFALYEIAKHPEDQRKIQEEIEKVLAKYDGQLTYDSINELKYLECCMDESLRLFPVVPMLNRMCVKEYKIPGTDVIIEKGTPVIIPLFPLHRDGQFYPNPEKFDPSRFFKENIGDKTYLDRPYYPFGEGPRYCIGTRMGKMSTKVALVAVLRKYRIELGDEHTGKELDLDPSAFIVRASPGVFLKLKVKHS